jgi:hypothetical protein
MRTSAKKEETAGLGATARRVAAWRARRRVGSPMPEKLWGEAVRLAQIHGVRAAAVGLGVDYGKLRKLATLAGRGLARAGRARRVSGPAFIDMGPVGELAGGSEPLARGGTTVIEVDFVTGDRLAIRTSGEQPVDVAQLVREFRGKP